MHYLFDTEGFSMYELEASDLADRTAGEGEGLRPGSVLIYPACVREPQIGYEVEAAYDADEAVETARRIAEGERGMGVGYMLRTADAALEDGRERRRKRLSGRAGNRGKRRAAASEADERRLDALRAVEREAARLRGLGGDLARMLDCGAEPGGELDAYLRAEGVPYRTREGGLACAVDLYAAERDAWEAHGMLVDAIGEEEAGDALDEALAGLEACREAVSSMRGLLADLERDEAVLRELADSAADKLGLDADDRPGDPGDDPDGRPCMPLAKARRMLRNYLEN